MQQMHPNGRKAMAMQKLEIQITGPVPFLSEAI